MVLSKDAGASLKRKLVALIEEQLFDDDVEVRMAQQVAADLTRRHLDGADVTNKRRFWGGSRPGKRPNKNRDFQAAYEKIMRQ